MMALRFQMEVCVCVRHPTSLASLGGWVGAGWPITLIVTCIMSLGGMANHTHHYLYHVLGGMANHTHRYLYVFGGEGQSHSSLLVSCLWGGMANHTHHYLYHGGGGGGGGWFRYPITDLPPPNDVHNLQSLQGARRKLTSQFDYYLHLDIVTPREREKLSLLQQTNVTISTCKSANSKQCSTQHHGHVRTLVYGSVYKAGYQ